MASKFNAGGVYVTFDGDDKPLNKTLKSIQGNIEGKLTGAIMKFGQAFAAAFAVKKIASFMKESQKLYKVQEQAEVKLAQLMKNAGKYTKENFNEMKAYAGELQKLSNYGDEFVMPIIADLSKAKLSTEQLKEATKATLDIMAAGGEAGMLSRVLEKPLEMSGALHRMGILINKEELKGLTLEQQRSKVLDEVNKKYGGMAEVMADPLTQIRNAIGDLKEKFGKTFDNFIGKNSDKIKNLINRISDSIQPTLDNITIILDAAVLTVQKVSKILEPLITKLSGLFKEFSKLIGKTLSDSNLAKNWESYIENLQGGYRVDELRETYKNKDTGAVDRALIKQAIQEAIDKNNKAKEKSDYGLVNNLIAAMNKYGNRDVNDPNQFVGHDRLGNKVTDTEEYIRKFLTTQDYSDWTTKFVIEEMLKKVKADDKDLYKELKNQYDQILKQRKKFGQIVENTHLDEINKQLEDTLADLASFDNGTLDEKTDKILNRTGDNNSKEFFGLDKFIESINKSMMEEEDAVTKAKNELTKQMQELIDQGNADGKTLMDGAKEAAEKAIEAYSVWNGIDSVTNDFKTLASQTNISVEEYSKSLSELGGKYQELLKKQEEIRKKINNEADKLSDKQKEMLEQTIADNDRKLKDLAAAAIEAAENFVELFFEPLKELETQATNSIGSISGGSVASFYTSNKKAKQDISDYRANADKTYRNARDNIQNNASFTQEQKNAAMQRASADRAAAQATAKRMEADQKAAAETEGLTLALSLASEALNTAADSIANNLEAEGDSERAADVREGAQIVSDSINNFMQGFAQGGPIMGLVMMIIGWIKELLERMGKYLHSLEAIFVSVSKAFDLVASLISPIALALEVLLTPITLLTEVLSAIADILTPIMELMADVIDLFLKPFFSIVRTVFKPLVDAVKKITSGIRESLGIGGVEDIDYSAQYDEMIGGINAILNALNEEKAILERHRALTQKINETANELYALQKGDAEAEFEKGVLTELFKTRLAEIEANKLYKDTSVNLAEYQKVIKQNGDIDIQQGKKLLFQLEHSELDANDFYAGNTEKLKELLNSLIQYQQDEDDRAVRAANAYNAQKANNAELSKIAEDFAALPEPITNSAIFLDDIQKQQSALDNTLNAYADENKELLDKGNDINQGGLSNVSEDVESTDSSVNNLTKVLLAINGHAVTNVSDYIDQVNKEIAAAEKAKQANEYRQQLIREMSVKIEGLSYADNMGDETAIHNAGKNKAAEMLNSLSDDDVIKEYQNLRAKIANVDSYDLREGRDYWGWGHQWSLADATSVNKSALEDAVAKYFSFVLAAKGKGRKYATGGWTGNIPIDKISGFVHGQEYVVKAPYAADYRPMLEAINEGRGSSIFGNQSALQNVNINIDSTVRANDPLSMINEWNKELRNRNLRLELKKV